MQKGFNSDLNVRGKKYHIQTEDWGHGNPFLVSRVFSGGAVLKTIKTSYTEALRGGPVNDEKALRQALQQQHTRVVDELMKNQSQSIY